MSLWEGSQYDYVSQSLRQLHAYEEGVRIARMRAHRYKEPERDIRQACRDRGGVPVDSNDRQGFVLAIRCDLP